MKLRNLTGETRTVLDAGDGLGRAVTPGCECDFTELGARELLASFPAHWAPAPETEVPTPARAADSKER